MNRKIGLLLLISFSVLFLLSSCSDQSKSNSSSRNSTEPITDIQTVSADEANLIKVNDYFPPMITRNQYISPNGDGTNQVIIEVAKFAVGLNNDTERIIESFNYQDNVELGHDVNQYTVTKTEIKSDNGPVYLANKSHWKSDDMEHYIVSTNKTVQVQAGKFDNCLEVLRIDPKTKWESKWTYAPQVGVIKMTSKSKGQKEKISAELTSTDTTPYGDNNHEEFNAGFFQKGMYSNEQLNFSLIAPIDWDGIVKVEKGNWTPEADYIIDFFYTPPNSDIKENIFSILVFEKEIDATEWDSLYPLWNHIISKNGRTYAYVTPGEPSLEILEPNNSDKLEFIQKMIYTDLPTVIQSFKIIEE